MKNQVIEVLNKEHGKKVIEYWKSRGVDTSGVYGSLTKEDCEEFRYYGVINNRFNCYTIEFVRKCNAEIIELQEEKPFPRVMLVSDDEIKWYKRVVFMKKNDRFLAWFSAETIEESESIYETYTWYYAKEVEPRQITITLSDLNSKIEDIKKLFGFDNEDVIIKLD